MSKFYVDEDSSMMITGMREVPTDFTIESLNELWKLDSIELPDELVVEWKKIRSDLTALEDQIQKLQTEQASANSRAIREWIATDKRRNSI